MIRVVSTHPSPNDVRRAVAAVDDPEYPGVSIDELGLVESIDIDPDSGAVTIGLVPTFSGCPALAIIAEDVAHSVRQITGVSHVNVKWLMVPVWSTDRISPSARAALARDFTVAVSTPVAFGRPTVRCPRCGGGTSEQSAFGPSRCRSIHRCEECGEIVEAMRSAG